MMTIATMDIAQAMGLSEAELVRKALVIFLQDQRREVLQARWEILSRYHATTIAELEERIANANVPEHPGWEDLILDENLDARLEEIDVYLRDL